MDIAEYNRIGYDGQVRMMIINQFDHCFQVIRADIIIGINETDILAACAIQSVIPGIRNAAILFVNNRNPSVLRSIAITDNPTLIC